MLERQLSNLTFLERYIDSPEKFEVAIQPRFSLLQVTLEIYRWRHKTTKSVVYRGRSTSLLSARHKFATFVLVESNEMDLLREEFLGQMRNMRHEMRLYRGFGHQGNKRPLPVPSLRFVPRFSVVKHPTRTMFQTHSTHAVPCLRNEKDSNDLRLAAQLSQMFFGNILEGQACSTCFTTYREPFPTDCSGSENRYRKGCDILRNRFLNSLKPSQSYRVLRLVIAKFLSSYDTFAIRSGLQNLSECWYDPDKFQGHKQFSRFLHIISAFSSGMAECQKSRLVQTELRRRFRGLHKFCWDTAWSDQRTFE
jgi:hypothetical protein